MNETAGRVMSVRTDLVREHLVAAIVAAADERYPGHAPEEHSRAMRDALVNVLGPKGIASASSESYVLAERVARAGYLARDVELDTFEPARRRAGWLCDLVRERMATGDDAPRAEAELEICRELARAEPQGRPDPGDDAASWRVPGPGGHVRHYVAIESTTRFLRANPAGEPQLPATIESLGQLKRCWTFGFLLRCCEELGPEDP